MSNATDIYATGRKGDLRVEFGYGVKTEGSTRRQPVLVLSHHLRPERQVCIYMDDAHQWDIRQEGNPRAAMLNAMQAADTLYSEGFVDKRHVFRILDTVYEWTQDLLRKTPAPVKTPEQFARQIEQDGVRVTATHKSGDKVIMLDAR
jgi:hypothetical protein